MTSLGLRLAVRPGTARLARQVRERRLALELTQRQLGDRLGWPTNNGGCLRISRIETSVTTRVELEWLCDLAEALKCTPNDLLEWPGAGNDPVSI